MAKLNVSTIQVPYESHNLKCPVCETDLEVVCTVVLNEGSVRHAGTAAFRQPILAANISAEAKTIIIREHQCPVPRGTDG
jgi:DNA-binding helix-hairpin-helix protein with protein kinase domain